MGWGGWGGEEARGVLGPRESLLWAPYSRTTDAPNVTRLMSPLNLFLGGGYPLPTECDD